MAGYGVAGQSLLLGEGYNEDQLHAIRQYASTVGVVETHGPGVLGKTVQDLLNDGGDQETSLGAFTKFGSGPRGIKKVASNLLLGSMWYFLGFFLCDLVYHDFDIVSSLLHLPDSLLGPIRWFWQDTLGMDPVYVILFDRLRLLPAPVQDLAVWICRNVDGAQQSGYCPNCEYVVTPGKPTTTGDMLECETKCALSINPTCVSDCLERIAGGSSEWVCDLSISPGGVSNPPGCEDESQGQ